jgi:hypothetical protein
MSNVTPEQYHAEILQDLITSRGKDMGVGHVSLQSSISLQSSRGGLGDEAGDLIMNLIGVNPLNEDETRSVLLIVRAVFEKPESIPQSARRPSRTFLLLQQPGGFDGSAKPETADRRDHSVYSGTSLRRSRPTWPGIFLKQRS